MIISVLVLGTTRAHALSKQNQSNAMEFALKLALYEDVKFQRAPPTTYLYHEYAQSQKEFKSRGAVMSEVKQRYDGKILKIKLNQAAEVYVVRLLMPNGKVRTVRVSARR